MENLAVSKAISNFKEIRGVRLDNLAYGFEGISDAVNRSSSFERKF